MARRGRRSRSRSRWGTVRAKASGNYQASYRHGGIPGAVPSTVYTAPTTFQTEGDARVWLEVERRLIETGQWTPPADREAARQQAEEALANRLTVASYARQWLERNADLRPSTRARYESSLRYYVLAQPLAQGKTKTWRTSTGLGDVQLHELTSSWLHRSTSAVRASPVFTAMWNRLRRPKYWRSRTRCPSDGDLLIDDVKTHLRDHAQLGADGLLFWGTDGRNADDRAWRRAWLSACSAAGVEGIRFHDLRHVGLTYTAVAGATLRELQAMAGHTTPTMALQYQEIAADHMAEVVKSLDAIISTATAAAGQNQRG